MGGGVISFEHRIRIVQEGSSRVTAKIVHSNEW